jgi:hypothetical protein
MQLIRRESVEYEKHGRFFIFFGKRDTVETDDILF